MTASAPYVRENGVSPVDLLRVVWYAQRTLGNSSAHLPLVPSNLFFNPFIMALLVALAWPLLYGYAGVEYLFMMPRLLQNSWKVLLSNCNPLSDTRDSGTLNLCYYVSPYKLLNIHIPNICQCLCLRLRPLGEIIYGHKNKPSVSYSLRELTKNI